MYLLTLLLQLGRLLVIPDSRMCVTMGAKFMLLHLRIGLLMTLLLISTYHRFDLFLPALVHQIMDMAVDQNWLLPALNCDMRQNQTCPVDVPSHDTEPMPVPTATSSTILASSSYATLLFLVLSLATQLATPIILLAFYTKRASGVKSVAKPKPKLSVDEKTPSSLAFATLPVECHSFLAALLYSWWGQTWAMPFLLIKLLLSPYHRMTKSLAIMLSVLVSPTMGLGFLLVSRRVERQALIKLVITLAIANAFMPGVNQCPAPKVVSVDSTLITALATTRELFRQTTNVSKSKNTTALVLLLLLLFLPTTEARSNMYKQLEEDLDLFNQLQGELLYGLIYLFYAAIVATCLFFAVAYWYHDQTLLLPGRRVPDYCMLVISIRSWFHTHTILRNHRQRSTIRTNSLWAIKTHLLLLLQDHPGPWLFMLCRMLLNHLPKISQSLLAAILVARYTPARAATLIGTVFFALIQPAAAYELGPFTSMYWTWFTTASSVVAELIVNQLKNLCWLIFQQMPLTIVDFWTVFMCLLFVLLALRKRFTALGCTGACVLSLALSITGLDHYCWWFIMGCLLCNVLFISLTGTPILPAMIPLLLLNSFWGVYKYWMHQIITFQEMPPLMYQAIFFGCAALEFTPWIASATLVIEKDISTGKITSTYRKQGPITTLLLGDISVSWDVLAMSPSAAIGEVVNANRFQSALKNAYKLQRIVDKDQVLKLFKVAKTVCDDRANGYITQHDQFIANCQAVTHNDMTGILANNHAVYDEHGKFRDGLKFHFPGQDVETVASPAVTHAGHDLCILAPETEIKYAYQITNAVPKDVIVSGYNKDRKKFQQMAQNHNQLVQMPLDRGHSGCALVNPETAKLCGILWLTAKDANLAQFVGLNPWAVTAKRDLEQHWLNQSVDFRDKLAAKADNHQLAIKLKQERKRILQKQQLAKPEIEACKKKLAEIEREIAATNTDATDLSMEHLLLLNLADEVSKEKRTAKQRLLALRSEKELLLKHRNALSATDTSLLAQLRKDKQQSQQKLDLITEQLKEKCAYKPPLESRMPSGLPQVRWPIIYYEDKKWHIFWSLEEHQELDSTPLSDNDVLARVCTDTGLVRKAAIKLLANCVYNIDWAKSLIEKAKGSPQESALKAWLDWLTGQARVTCLNCGRKFTCQINHKHGAECEKEQALNCERHQDYCNMNSFKGNCIHYDGWNYPIVRDDQGSKVALGFGTNYVVKCPRNHDCVTNKTPAKRSDFYRLNGPEQTDWWVPRACIEGLHKQYNALDIKMPENESLLNLLDAQNRAKNVESAMNGLMDKLEQSVEARQSVDDLYNAALDDLDSRNDEIDRLNAQMKAQAAIIQDLEHQLKMQKQINDALSVEIAKLSVVQKSAAPSEHPSSSGQQSQNQNSPPSSTSTTGNPETPKPRRERRARSKSADKTPAAPSEQQPRSTSPSPKQSAAVGKMRPYSPYPVSDEQPPFNKASKSSHTRWLYGHECKCHQCECSENCNCFEQKLCVWCNNHEHNTMDCPHLAKGVCSCGKEKLFNKTSSCCNSCECVVCSGKHHSMCCPIWNKKHWTTKKSTEPRFNAWFKQPDFRLSPSRPECGWTDAVRQNLRRQAIDGVLTITYTGGLFSRAVLQHLVPKDLEIVLSCTPETVREKLMAENTGYRTIGYTQNAVKLDPIDLDKERGVFSAKCTCGTCVDRFTKQSIMQASRPLKDLNVLIEHVFETESMENAKDGQPGPGFEHLFVEPPREYGFPRVSPKDIILFDNWEFKIPNRTKISDPVEPHTGKVTNVKWVPQKAPKRLEETRYTPQETERYPSSTAMRFIDLECLDHGPSTPCLNMARDDIQKYGDVQHRPLRESVDLKTLIQAIKNVLTQLNMSPRQFPLASWEQVEQQRQWGTSPGYPLNCNFATSRAAYDATYNYLKTFMDEHFKQWSPTIYNIIAKDEILPKQKAKQKVRTILGPSLDHQLVSQILTMPIVLHQNKQSGNSPSKLGSSKFHGHYHDAIAPFEAPVVEYDASGWDRNVHPTLLRIWFYVFWCLLKEDSEEVFTALSNIFESTIYSHMVYPNGQLVRKHTGLPSGATFTANLNTLVHMTIQEYNRVKCHEPVWYMCYGDDGLMQSNQSDSDIRKAFSIFGMNLDKAFKRSNTAEGLGWLGTTISKSGDTFVPLGNYKKALASIYWSKGLNNKKDANYEICVTYSLICECAWCPDVQLQILYNILVALCKESGDTTDVYSFPELGDVDPVTIKRLALLGYRDFRDTIRRTMYAREIQQETEG
uniref:RNA-dependent RNA polymerase n=1 Tax=Beihai mudskipper astro-like virus TaxID=2116128 RepID=A0A2P1GMB7_9VIRU|nr:RNA-dependent RNA polymerase [Beihai mudskipper astro-like virus]